MGWSGSKGRPLTTHTVKDNKCSWCGKNITVMDIAFENEQIPRYNVYRCPDCDTLLYVRSDFPVLRPREKGANKK